MKNIREKFEKIKEIVRVKSIHCARVPEITRDYFQELANKEFESDYGMCLKFLCDLHKGYFPTGHEEIEAKIDLLASELANIKEQLPKQKKRKTVDGKEHRIGGKNETR